MAFSRQAYPCISRSAVESLGIWCLLTFGVSNVNSRFCVIDARLHFIQPWCLDDAQGRSRGCCLHWPCRVSDALTYYCWLDDCHRYPAVAAGWCQHTRTDILEGTFSTPLFAIRHSGTLEQSPRKLCTIQRLCRGKHMIRQSVPSSINQPKA